MPLKNKDLLGLKEITQEEINEILQTATVMKQIIKKNNKKTPHLQGKTIITLFYENSTRTRLSFELAAKYMSGNAANISASTSSVAKGETLLDTGRTIEVMGTDVIIIRHPMAGAPHMLAKYVSSSVINAGDGMNEHPTQALLDLYSMKEKKNDLNGLKVAIVGDIYHSRVARSNIWGLNKMGAQVYVSAPKTLLPPKIEGMGVTVCNRVEDAIADADVVMGLRLQKERQQSGLLPSLREYATEYGINSARIQLANENCLIMHPGPVNRGVEMTSAIVDHPQSVIDEQVLNGVAVRMALLYLLSRKEAKG